ncbi:MAG: glycine--tRNA ligase subunit beta, partial [Gammaproteobacteria bacterium]|nr:glycine--tRNA ligase subunit beta [Gammaproteobacteria bacterium]
MADTRDLLIEIGTEELPPKALRRLSQAFAAGITAGLAKADLAHGEVLTYASPRRLAVHIRSLQSAQADRVLERRGPALRAAFDDDGRPTRAAQGFAGSCGVAVEALEKLETEQGAWLVFRSQQPGQPTAALV